MCQGVKMEEIIDRKEKGVRCKVEHASPHFEHKERGLDIKTVI